MKGKLIGILSDDFRLYHELVTHLKARDVPFVSLSASENVPINVGAVITTRKLAESVNAKNKVVCRSLEDVEFAVNKALLLLKGKERFDEIVVGIDPGAKPGIAVLGDGEVLNSLIAKRPEDVVDIVKRTKGVYLSDRLRIKIGHGDKVNRNRIINSLAAEDFAVLVVDEKSTTKDARHGARPKTRSKRVDAFAALQIAQGDGYELKDLDYTPTKGELKLVQSRSRTLSSGRITISKALAELVARGEITLKKALSLQDRKHSKKKKGKKKEKKNK